MKAVLLSNAKRPRVLILLGLSTVVTLNAFVRYICWFTPSHNSSFFRAKQTQSTGYADTKMPPGEDRQQLLAGLDQLKEVHERQQDIFITYQDLEVSLKELQVRISQVVESSYERQGQIFSLSLSYVSHLHVLTGTAVTFVDSCRRRRRCYDASKDPRHFQGVCRYRAGLQA